MTETNLIDETAIPEPVAITDELIAEHGLSDDEYKHLLEIIGREPSSTELGIFSVMWSEHCSYKSSRFHLKKLPTDGPQGPEIRTGRNTGGKPIEVKRHHQITLTTDPYIKPALRFNISL